MTYSPQKDKLKQRVLALPKQSRRPGVSNYTADGFERVYADSKARVPTDFRLFTADYQQFRVDLTVYRIFIGGPGAPAPEWMDTAEQITINNVPAVVLNRPAPLDVNDIHVELWNMLDRGEDTHREDARTAESFEAKWEEAQELALKSHPAESPAYRQWYAGQNMWRFYFGTKGMRGEAPPKWIADLQPQRVQESSGARPAASLSPPSVRQRRKELFRIAHGTAQPAVTTSTALATAAAIEATAATNSSERQPSSQEISTAPLQTNNSQQQQQQQTPADLSGDIEAALYGPLLDEHLPHWRRR